MNYNIFFVVLPCLLAYCLSEITQETQLPDLNNDYNVQPNQEQSTRDGYQPSTEEIVSAFFLGLVANKTYDEGYRDFGPLAVSYVIIALNVFHFARKYTHQATVSNQVN